MPLNWDDVPTSQDSEYKPIPEGIYTVICDKAEMTTARSSGTPMIALTLKVQGPSHAGRLIWDNLVLTQKAAPKAKMAFAAFGSPLSGEMDPDPDTLVGQVAEVFMIIEPDNRGIDRNKIPFDGYDTERHKNTPSVDKVVEKAQELGATAAAQDDEDILF